MSRIQYQREKVRDMWDECVPLLEEHYREIGLYNDKVSFSPDVEKYEMLCDMDLLYIITARDEGKLVGYYACFIQPSLHYTETLCSVNDVFYIAPSYRKGFTGIRLLKEAESHMRDRGVDVLSLSFKTYLPLDPLFERLGWDYSERVYTKYIGE